MIRKIVEKVSGRYLFLISTVLIYLVVLLINFDTAVAALSIFAKLCLKILPILAIVLGLLFISNFFLETRQMVKYLGKKSGLKGWMLTIVGGVISAGPIYMWYPLLSDLKEKGMKESLIAAFLYNRAVKIPLMPMMVFYFGIKLTVILTIYMVLFSVFNGYLVGFLLSVNKRRKKK